MGGFSSGGKCLCGKVRFNIATAVFDIELCHCKMCRRWGGGLPLAVVYAKVVLEKDETLVWWQSSIWGARGFCACCGCSLFWRLLGDNQEEWEVSVGALDNESGLAIVRHIFCGDKPAFYEMADEAKRHSGAELADGSS